MVAGKPYTKRKAFEGTQKPSLKYNVKEKIFQFHRFLIFTNILNKFQFIDI
jgi:hypothetical protein